MEILKAIELNEESIKSLRGHKFYDHADAVQMGNEGLIRLKGNRESPTHASTRLLPGETPAESKPPRKGHPITRLPIRKGK